MSEEKDGKRTVADFLLERLRLWGAAPRRS
jgi:hypothetical protein